MPAGAVLQATLKYNDEVVERKDLTVENNQLISSLFEQKGNKTVEELGNTGLTSPPKTKHEIIMPHPPVHDEDDENENNYKLKR